MIGDVARLRVPMGVLSFVSFAAISVVVVVVVTARLKAILESVYYTFDSVSIAFRNEIPMSNQSTIGVENHENKRVASASSARFRSATRLDHPPRNVELFAVVATTASRVNSHYYYLSKSISRGESEDETTTTTANE